MGEQPAEQAALQRKLQLKPGSVLWVWPEVQQLPEPFAGMDDITHGDLPDADVAVLVVADRAAVDAVLQTHREALARVRAVWIIYAKGNKTDVNRDTLWVQLAEYGWRTVSQVSFNDTDSALRVRPLREGEVPRTK